MEMTSQNIASNAKHEPLPLTDVTDSFSDDELEQGDADSESDQLYAHRRGLTMNHCKIFFGIAIGIGAGILIGARISLPGKTQIIPAPANAGITGNSSVWLVENMTE